MAKQKTTTEPAPGEKTRRVSNLPAAHLEMMLLDDYGEKEAGRKRATLPARVAGEMHLVSDDPRGTEFAAPTGRERQELGAAIDRAEMDLGLAKPLPVPAELAKWFGSPGGRPPPLDPPPPLEG